MHICKNKQPFRNSLSIYLFKKRFSTSPKSSYKKFDTSDLKYFQSIIPKEDVLTSDLDMYNTDWLKKYIGNAPVVLKPKTTEQVSKILAYCNKNNLAVVPQGGNTGLVGGSVPFAEEIIINLSNMNRVISFDEISNTLHCEAGCILETLNSYLGSQGKGYTMPIDLGAKGSCFIGGNLATNAGGIHFVKYGSMRKNCKGLKAVLPDGSIIDSLNPLPKNNTGYDLKQLFIGSEGTLAIITECLINAPLKPAFTELALIACEKFTDILKIYQESKSKLGEDLYAIEFFDKQAREIQEKHGRMAPLPDMAPFYLVLEIAEYNAESTAEDNRKKLEDFLISIEPLDAVIAQDEAQKAKIWELRESISEGTAREGIVFSYDISLPLEKFYEIVEDTRRRVSELNPQYKVVGYGHIGDYNLHLNVCYDKFIKDSGYKQLESLLEPYIYDYLTKYRGSISAEHGIGLHKAQYLNRSQSEESINLMKLIKQTIDPNGIMNPYKVIKF